MRRTHIILALAAPAALLLLAGAAWALGRLDFFRPWWLAGLLALAPAAWLAARSQAGLPPRPNAVALALRGLVVVLLVFALADLQQVRESDRVCVFFLLDHSASVPEPILEQELAYANAAAATRRGADTAGVIVFGETPSVEILPQPGLAVERIYSFVGRQHTDLAAAVDLAVAAFPAEGRRKIVLVTDGNETAGSLLESVKAAASRQVQTDILPVAYAYEKEVLVESISLPDAVREHEPFDLRVTVNALRSGPAELAIYRNGARVGGRKVDLQTGRNAYSVSLKLDEPGFHTFTARVSSDLDTVPDNNAASDYVYIEGASRLLVVASAEVEVRHLVRVCRQENLEADVIAPAQFPDSLGQLQNYDAVILANVASDEFSNDQLAMVRAAVRDLGLGLIMLGGENSFGAGGYEKTPVEEALPVTMDIAQRKIYPKGALALVLHTCEFADGNYWAKEITKKAIEAVSPQDDVGVLLYDSGDRWLFPLQPAANKPALFRQIDEASPGDMPAFEPTIRLAYEGLMRSDAMIRHIVVISDGDPASPQPQLIKDMAASGVTISTVAINPHSPRDVEVMKYLAYTTGGRYYFADDPSQLPQIFVKEAKVVKRSLIFNQKFQPLPAAPGELLRGVDAARIPPLLAYVATTPKPLSTVELISDNENRDPVLASWRFGLGKAVAFMSDASPNWGREWVAWDQYAKVWSQIVRWSARKREKSDLRLRTELEGGRGRLIVDAVDASGRFLNFLKLSGRVVRPDNTGAPLELRQVAPGRYEAEFEARQTGVNILNVGWQNPASGGQGFVAAGVSVPYSPEYRQLESNLGLLQAAAAAGGGRVLTGEPARDDVYRSALPPSRSLRSVWDRLLWLALVLWLADVVIRRVVITREDWRAAWAAARRLTGRRAARAGSEQTLAALLDRKRQTFQPAAAPLPGKAAAAFKSRLDRESQARPAGGPEVESLLAQARPAEAPPAAGPAPGAPGPAPAAPPTAGSEDAYTSRLLAAKRRVRPSPPGPDAGKGDGAI